MRTKWVAAISLIILGIGGLAAWAILSPGALAYYATPTELAGRDAVSDDRTVRLGGRVVDGTLERRGIRVAFEVTDGTERVRVRYRGEIPDTLKEGTDVIAEGKIFADGVLMAQRLQAKCSSKFVPKDRPEHLGRT